MKEGRKWEKKRKSNCYLINFRLDLIGNIDIYLIFGLDLIWKVSHPTSGKKLLKTI